MGLTPAFALRNSDTAGGPIGEEHLADDALAGDQAPDAGVAGVGAIVALHQVHVLGDARQVPRRRDVVHRPRFRVPSVGFDVGLGEASAVDVRVAAALRPDIAWEPDHALHEDASGAFAGRELRRVKDDDLAAL